ncbi:hypothetical protein SAMN05660841_03061 [Sphingobacterium nematocida]|uniref:Uncharacterized protein n=1 Tax=Sphingobacterium nematocida TaxID=1513896 RepID=A0A1T5F5V0_9SPHI|nr:hypothetical protein [Sphingobacterium nematocida]SKB91546.1 hypothetical protein SAMN05660841_03061 [Sphingobacterium nematocida]
MKHLLLVGFLFLGITSFSQTRKVINVDELTEVQLENLDEIVDKEGWVNIIFEGESSTRNFSNKEYILTVLMNCSDSSYVPKYLIEFTKHYRDGTYAYIDFVNSVTNKFTKTSFYIDRKDFGDPFSEFDKESFAVFHHALKSGKLLTISFYHMAMNPETGDDELSLNRSIDFKLANGELLDTPVDCNVFNQQESPVEEAVDDY